MNVPGSVQCLLTVQVDGFEIACSLLFGFPQPRASCCFTRNKSALLLYAHKAIPFLSGCFYTLYFEMLLKSNSQPSLCSITFPTAPSACLEVPKLAILFF